MKKLIFWMFLGVLAFGAGAGVVEAGIRFGAGEYVNLCGSGTAATTYRCDAGCRPLAGSCSGDNNGVVKWTCTGKWIQCLEAETDWANFAQLGNPGCGKTVQLGLFDKKCRREDGTWDSSCQMLGYMVWYSGDCERSATGVTTTPGAAVTVKPTVTATPTATPTPSPTPRSKFEITPSPTRTPTPVPAGAVCGKQCAESADCGAGFTCAGGVCRNPACPEDTSCFCGQVGGATNGGVITTPETGGEIWWLAGGVITAGVGGWYLRRMAVKIW